MLVGRACIRLAAALSAVTLLSACQFGTPVAGPAGGTGSAIASNAGAVPASSSAARPGSAFPSSVDAASVAASPGRAPAGARQYTLYQEPAAGTAPILAAIRSARSTVAMTMYELRDPTVEAALIEDAGRGVDVKVLLDKDYAGADVNAAAYRALSTSRARVRWEPGGTIVHQKTVIVDGAAAWISTGNLDDHYYPDTWDDWIADRNPAQVRAIAATFASDWNAAPGRIGSATAAPGLVWSPGAEQRVAALIGTARHSVDFASEELSDRPIIAALAADAHRGVRCRLVMTYSSKWRTAFRTLADAGCQVHTFPDRSDVLYVHTKQIIVDGTTVLIGSTNASASSLRRNRELSLELTSATAAPLLAALVSTFDAEFAAAS